MTNITYTKYLREEEFLKEKLSLSIGEQIEERGPLILNLTFKLWNPLMFKIQNVVSLSRSCT